MTKAFEYVLTCDHGACRSVTSAVAAKIETAKMEFRIQGWRLYRDLRSGRELHLCPVHRTEGPSYVQ